MRNPKKAIFTFVDQPTQPTQPTKPKPKKYWFRE